MSLWQNRSMKIEQQTLTPVSGIAKEIGFYLSGLQEVREQLRETVEDLSNEEISAKVLPNTHSIGQLILHCGEAEWWWIQCVVAGKNLGDEAKKKAHWDILLDEDFVSKNYSAQYCLETIDDISNLTLETLKNFPNEDLGRYFGWDKNDGTRIEKTLRWILHHLIDHEAQHKGQILMLKRLLKENNK